MFILCSYVLIANALCIALFLSPSLRALLARRYNCLDFSDCHSDSDVTTFVFISALWLLFFVIIIELCRLFKRTFWRD